MMNISEVRKRAKKAGINVGKQSKAELIRDIQTKEGNFPCFGTAKGHCDQTGCCWREDCLAN